MIYNSKQLTYILYITLYMQIPQSFLMEHDLINSFTFKRIINEETEHKQGDKDIKTEQVGETDI